MEGAGPLAEEQAQIECARVQHQPGMAAKVLVGKLAHLLMHRIFITADAFGLADAFQSSDDCPHVVLQANGIVANASGG